jgi:GH25 family lysozyme M1 (1,4-beta-N-acetylmuramidase)
LVANSGFAWVANRDVSVPAMPKPWPRWTFWQYTDSPVDTARFNGTKAQLPGFTRMPKSR